MFRTAVCSGLVVLLLALSADPVLAQTGAPTPEQRKELQDVQKDVSQIAGLLRKREYEEAEKVIEELRQRAEKIIADGKLASTDRTVGSLRKLIDTNRQRIAKALDKPDPTLISFSKEIAPILESRCGNCHGDDNPRARLNLSSFAGMKAGGQNGALLVPKVPARSLLLYKLTLQTPQGRMPANGNPLSLDEIQKIAVWVEQGALFDGEDETTPLADLARQATSATPSNEPPLVINKATGNETVSFVRDIAPTIVTLCTGCHGGNNPRSGLSVTNFETLMRGGDSGRVIIPGNLDGSRLWRLVGAGDQPRMPQGQARITRKFHADLQKWIEEGARFDGPDAKTPLRQLVPTDEDMLREKFAKMTDEEFREYRMTRTEEQWKRVSPRTTARYFASDEFLVYGDASEERLKQISDWAEEQGQQLRSLFGIKERPIWKGRLTVFVLKDRFGYTELNQVLQSRSTARDVHGHALVTTAFEDAYIAVEDVGDEPGATHGGLRVSVADHVTGAFLRKPGTSLPEWVIRGTGLALASRAVGANVYIDSLPAQAVGALKGLDAPENVFTDGRFGPGDVGPIGFTLVDFMIRSGGPPKFGQFIARLQSDPNVGAAVKAVYPPTDLKSLGTAYLASVAARGK